MKNLFLVAINVFFAMQLQGQVSNEMEVQQKVDKFIKAQMEQQFIPIIKWFDKVAH